MAKDHAVVLGGGLAGLLAARVLARHFERVTILERDDLPEGACSRRGVPQARHIHGLLVRGFRILEWLFPDLAGELTRAGAHTIDVMNDILRLGPGGWCPRAPSNYRTVACSRDLLEWGIRRQVLRDARVRVVEGFDASGLLVHPRTGHVCGVRNRRRGERDVFADWVVDATGRQSQTPAWLEELGYARVEETTVDSFAGYASRCYEAPSVPRNWKSLVIGSRPPDLPRAGALQPLEKNRWMVTLAGAAHDYPPTSEEGFLAFARSLADPLLYDVLRQARAVSRIYGYQRNESRVRHYERLGRMPSRFVVLGDAVCALNPVYGQGMTLAAMGAQLLDRCLAAAPSSTRFQRRLARANRIPWTMATAEDYRYPGTKGPPRAVWTKAAHAWMDRILFAAAKRENVHAQLVRVGHLLEDPISLLRPDIAFSAWRAHRSIRSEGDARIAPTAYYTAYVWHRLGMPHAKLFATARGAALFWGFRLAGEWLSLLSSRVPSTVQYLAMRHLAIEHELERMAPDRVVEIGAGLSRRGITWAPEKGIRYIEVDLPNIVKAKHARLAAAPRALRDRLDGRWSLLSFDILDARFGDWLAAQLEGARRPVVVAEGVLVYFDMAERARIVASVRKGLAASGGGAFLCDMRTVEEAGNMALAVNVLRGVIRLATRGRGTRADFPRIDDVRSFFARAGFASAEPVDRKVLPSNLAKLSSPVRVWAVQSSERTL
ncbi:FAD-dependent oxidoreductase [Pendulispora rubella]|uniref:FAD-dependent oxidoreductase n=1 Tax=Pendulispora rubella TaxID=2741070 RepID=A0ABZ2KQQ5_9BACT